MRNDLDRLRAYARLLLDASFRVPGTQWRFGVEALIGLIPGVGDLIGSVLSSYILLEAARHGVSTPTMARMIVNVALEVIVGAVPVLGDLFDAAFKANLRNIALLEREVTAGRPLRASKLYLGVVVASLAGLFVLAAVLCVLALNGLVEAVGNVLG